MKKIVYICSFLAFAFLLNFPLASSASAQSVMSQTTKETLCNVPDAADVISCRASCPKGWWAVSGHCRAQDTRGRALTVSSFGASSDAQDWTCDFMNARDIGMVNKPKLEPGIKLYVKAICLNR